MLSADQIQMNQCYVTGADARHISRVMRFSPGDRLICCDGRGRSVLAEIETLSDDEVVCKIIKPLPYTRELPVKVTIAQGLPKGDKFEWVMQKGTELGATRFIPFRAARSIVRYDGKKELTKRKRWEKIIKEAAEQAQRDVLPRLEPIVGFADICQEDARVKLVAYEQAALQKANLPAPFVQALNKLNQRDQLLVVIGPEGGLTPEEVGELQAHGFQTISLGKRILRTETAAQYVLAAVSFYFEQLGGSAKWPQ